MYKLIRPLLFALDPEASHNLTLGALKWLGRVPGGTCLLHRGVPELPVEVMGLRFPNPLGLAAGLDKNACCARAFAALGFGFVELGTVTPKPQPGNPKQRLFRLVPHEAIINRMGFNSAGLEVFLGNLRNRPRNTVIGINLGKNAATPVVHALDDYVSGMRAVYDHADYLSINISSPNTRDLRSLQDGASLDPLLAGLADTRAQLQEKSGRRVPLALKIAPDLEDAQVDAIAAALRKHCFDAVIATNTTVGREGVASHSLAGETGGLSGAPLRARSTAVIKQLYQNLKGEVPIIGVGGISTPEDAWEKLVAGADLLQLYSALIYRGPGIVAQILKGLNEQVQKGGYSNLTEAVAAARSDNG